MEPRFTEVTVRNEPGADTKTNRYVDGRCTWFHPSGTVCEIAHFSMGMLHGENARYDTSGNLTNYDFYYFGKRIHSS